MRPRSVSFEKWNDPFMIDIQQRSANFCVGPFALRQCHILRIRINSQRWVKTPLIIHTGPRTPKTREWRKKCWFAPRSDRDEWPERVQLFLLRKTTLDSLPLQAKTAERKKRQTICLPIFLAVSESAKGLLRMQDSVSIPFLCFVLRATRGSRKIRAGRYRTERSGGGEENPVVIRLKRSPILRPRRSRWAFSCVLVCRPKTM